MGIIGDHLVGDDKEPINNGLLYTGNGKFEFWHCNKLCIVEPGTTTWKCEQCGRRWAMDWTMSNKMTIESAPEHIADDPAGKNEALEDIFSYHKPDAAQIPKYTAIRDTAKDMAYVLDVNCPPSADRTAAMRLLQDAVMTANRSIALHGRSYR